MIKEEKGEQMDDREDILLITGNAGFIGMHVALKAAELGKRVLGLDNLNDYYDIDLKFARLREQGISTESLGYGETIWGNKNIGFVRGSIEDSELIAKLFEEFRITEVIHLAAQAGVRYSIDNPQVYIRSNIDGFFNILEACRHARVTHLVYASSSSVYGLNKVVPFKVTDSVDHPISLYAATKKSNELMAHTYSHLFGIPTTGLRFFTVYGPWGRPDMALFKFTRNIVEAKPIDVYNNGMMSRDFTYIDDIVEGIIRILNVPPASRKLEELDDNDPSTSTAPYRICNIGRNEPVKLESFIEAIESAVGKKAIRNYMPIQPGDVHQTYADVTTLQQLVGYVPKVGVTEGVGNFVDWYRAYYRV